MGYRKTEIGGRETANDQTPGRATVNDEAGNPDIIASLNIDAAGDIQQTNAGRQSGRSGDRRLGSEPGDRDERQDRQS